MKEEQVVHPISKTLSTLESTTFEVLYELFENIGYFWGNIDDSKSFRIDLYVFIQNRINLYPIYQEYYKTACRTLHRMIEQYGKEETYKKIFTDPFANTPPVDSDLSIVRQKVSNEFISLQLSLGGFKDFGAKNYCSYIGGANIPGSPAPYRTAEEN